MARTTARDIHNLIQSQLGDKDTGGGTIPNLLKMLSLPSTPQEAIGSTAPPEPIQQSNAVSSMVPDTGKIETNMAKNNLMSRFPGLGAK